MDSLPHRGFYKDIELSQQTGGIAPTVPWIGETAQAQDRVSVCCTVELPVIPFRIEKIYTLREGSATLEITESVRFKGDAPVSFTWTQHALFGGDFIDEHTRIEIPAQRVFDAWAQMRNLAECPEAFVYPIEQIPLRGTMRDLRHPLPPEYNGNEFLVFMDLNQGMAALTNPDLGLKVRLHYDVQRFPYLRSLYQSDADGIIIGLEPGNDRFSGFAHSYKYGTYTTMYPGETIDTWFKLEYVPESV
jgi:galactose mutarotase-like enzyme